MYLFGFADEIAYHLSVKVQYHHFNESCVNIVR